MYVCASVSVCVCVCVCGCAVAQMDGSILMKFSTNDLTDICEVRLTSWRPFCAFSLRHSHGRNFASIVFKI